MLLDNLFPNNAAHDRIKLGIFDARCLLKLCSGLRLRGDQLWARPERREVAADSARLVQLKAVVLLLEQGWERKRTRIRHRYNAREKIDNARRYRAPGRKADARDVPAACVRPSRS